MADLSRGIELDPKDPFTWSNRGAAYGRLGQRDKAIADVSKAIELDPKRVDDVRNLATLVGMSPEIKLPDPAHATLLLRNALELTPADVGAWQGLGWSFYRTGA